MLVVGNAVRQMQRIMGALYTAGLGVDKDVKAWTAASMSSVSQRMRSVTTISKSLPIVKTDLPALPGSPSLFHVLTPLTTPPLIPVPLAYRRVCVVVDLTGFTMSFQVARYSLSLHSSGNSKDRVS